jgi:hypothetical protein
VKLIFRFPDPDLGETMRCPVCRAENAEESACRRCRADLSLLVTVEQARRQAIALSASAAASGDGVTTSRHAQAAHQLRPDAGSWRWQAVGCLLQRDFTGALTYYQRARDSA